jgi:hypothetical protein
MKLKKEHINKTSLEDFFNIERRGKCERDNCEGCLINIMKFDNRKKKLGTHITISNKLSMCLISDWEKVYNELAILVPEEIFIYKIERDL